MPVIKADKQRQLVCDTCGRKSEPVDVHSVAADLDACEQLEPVGWTFDCDFFAMALGHTVRCPICNGHPVPRLRLMQCR